MILGYWGVGGRGAGLGRTHYLLICLMYRQDRGKSEVTVTSGASINNCQMIDQRGSSSTWICPKLHTVTVHSNPLSLLNWFCSAGPDGVLTGHVALMAHLQLQQSSVWHLLKHNLSSHLDQWFSNHVGFSGNKPLFICDTSSQRMVVCFVSKCQPYLTGGRSWGGYPYQIWLRTNRGIVLSITS